LILFFIPTFYCSFCPAYFLLNPFRHRLLFCRQQSNSQKKKQLEVDRREQASSAEQKKNQEEWFREMDSTEYQRKSNLIRQVTS
jgi:hypothetical protein